MLRKKICLQRLFKSAFCTALISELVRKRIPDPGGSYYYYYYSAISIAPRSRDAANALRRQLRIESKCPCRIAWYRKLTHLNNSRVTRQPTATQSFVNVEDCSNRRTEQGFHVRAQRTSAVVDVGVTKWNRCTFHVNARSFDGHWSDRPRLSAVCTLL